MLNEVDFGDRKFSIVAICALNKWTLKELSERTGINEGHLRQVSAGYIKMTADDLIAISEVSGIPPRLIERK